MIKVVFFDIDDTLFSHKTRSVPQSTRDALRALKEKGIRRVIATGRQMQAIDKLPFEGLDFDGYITVNGQLILDGSRQLLGHTPIQGRLLEQVLEMFEERKIPVLLVEKDRMYVNFVDDHVLEVQRRINTPVSRIDTYRGDHVYQACIYLTKENEPAIEPMRPYAEVNWWTWGGADVVCSGSDKSMGIQKYLQVNGFTREECMAFGDGDNDVGMLRYAGIGVAVGNGTNEAKKAADYVTGDIDDGGIETALRHFGIL
jgi:Cof subfamily protein (haloacid dehalogenase superfamily)